MFAKLTIFFFAAFSFAHQSGHGPRLAGAGPSGGKLASVISASQAEKGDQAHAVGAAEFLFSGERLTVKLLKADKKTAAATPAGTLKWILFPSEGKPVVIEANTLAVKEMTLDRPDMSKLEAIELILPGFEKLTEKHVVYLKL